ncbi:MAG: hypothetical protein U5N26_05380 [Candidatus Marinimicrobia bacterium]|nr:hypothetical protein [Candidatus Neomarinimicrobiota bacterium]
MKRRYLVSLIALLGISLLSAQFSGEVPEFKREGVGYDFSNAKEQAAFLDWSRIQMRHGVSMSMGSSALGSESYLTYHNQFYMPLSSRLSFYGNLYLAAPGLCFQSGPGTHKQPCRRHLL